MSLMPVASMKAGSWKGGFSMPRLPCRYLRFCDQCLGTGTVFRYDCATREARRRLSFRAADAQLARSAERRLRNDAEA